MSYPTILCFLVQMCYHYEMNNYRFPIIIEQDADGYFVRCPELQGCYSQGATYEEAMVHIKDAIKLHIQDRIAEREKMPRAMSLSVGSIEVAA